MTILHLILGVGITVAIVFVALFVLFERAAARRRQTVTGPRIVKTYATPLQINPGLIMSKLGQGQPAQRSLDMMVMRPTWGIKLFGVVMLGLLAMVMFGAGGEQFRQELTLWIMVGGALVYMIAFALLYEVRYDSEGITAPNMFFQPTHYRWSKLISVTMVDTVHYKLLFEDGTLKIKKFLVGMDTLLTFIADVQEMNRKL